MGYSLGASAGQSSHFCKTKKGVKKVLVFSPSFTSDCLETIIEIGYEYKELFINSGGLKLDYVESLNFSDSWVQAIINILKSK